MPMRDILLDLNDEIDGFTYDEKFLPDEIMWLLLALPRENHFGRVSRLKINIPRTLIFGVRKDGIELYTDPKGYIVHKFVNVDQCMTAFPFSPTDVLAHEKEMSIRAVTDVANVCKYQGMYNTNLTHKGYRRLIADTFKQVQAHTTRNFSIREHVALRHGKYNKNPFNRVVYRLYGKTTILSITTNDTGAEDSSKRNASKQDIKIKEKGTGKDQEQEKKEKMNWKQLVQVGLSDSKGRAVKVQKVIGEEKEQGGNRPTESSDTPAKRRPTIKDIASIISYQNIAAKQQVATKEQMEKLEEQSAREQRRLELATQAASDKKEQENAWYYDAEEEEQEEMFEQVVHKRTLETFESTKYNVTEMNELAAADLHDLVTLIVDHINFLTKKQLSTLVIDFVKNANNNYVLNDLIAFQFDRTDSVTQSKYNVARRPVLVKFQIESFFKCDLDAVSTDIDADADAKEEDEQDGEGDNMCTVIAAALKAQAMADGEDIQTSNTVLCRMCTSRINSTSSRYHVTSTMIYSTVMHIRARIPAHDWPPFCSDNSYTLLSMHRNIKSITGEGTSRGTTTEANLFLCASCYRLYQEETNLIQLEHQIGVLTKNQGLKPPSADDSTLVATPATLTKDGGKLSPKHHTSSPKKSIITGPPKSTRRSSPQRSSAMSSAGRSVTATSTRPSSAPAIGKSRSPTKKMSLFSSASVSSRPSINSLPAATASERFRNRVGSSISTDASKRERTTKIAKHTEEEKRRNTLYQLAKPQALAEAYTSSFLVQKKTPNELLSDSDIRDKFRDKNNPSNHTVPFFIDNENKTKSANKPSSLTSAQVEGSKTYPKLSDPPAGNVVSRTDVPLHITVCRLAVNLHEVVDLPVAIFEAYENFSLCYVALGRRVDAPCVRTPGFKRRVESKFKEARPILTDINGGSDSDSSSASSGSSSTFSTSSTSSKKKKKKTSKETKESNSDSVSVSDDEDDDDAFSDSCASVEKEVVVGSLECRFFKVSYVMINGDAKSNEYHEPLTQFFQDFKCITVVLCATLKPSAVIADNNWSIPNVQDLSKSKASRLRTKIRDIKKGNVVDDDILKPLPRRRPSSSSVAYKPPTPPGAKLRTSYDPREKVEVTTESGLVLPPTAIAYGHIPLAQFKGNTVQRVDVGIPLTYTIQHLPRARTVPMLKGMVGFDRPLYPIDIWALPYSMLQLHERNAYVPLVENQYSSTMPLPAEWVSVKMQSQDARRGKAMFKQRSSVSAISGSLSGSMNDVTAGIDSVKRNAPTIHKSQARSEITQMVTEKNTSTNLSYLMRNEVDLERQPGSVWCVCVQVLSAQHIHSDGDFYSQKKQSFECVFRAFGDKTRLIGDLVEADGGDGGEVKFMSNETKFLFSSSISALEHMFDGMDPTPLKFKPLKDNPDSDLPQYARTLSVSSSKARKKSFQRTDRKMAGLGSSATDLMDNKTSTGHIRFKNLHKDRFMEVSVPVVQDVLTEELAHKNEMYPPYAHVILKLYRVGPPHISECGVWLPPRMVMGHDIGRGVKRVQYSYRL